MDRIQIRRGTAAAWAAANPTLLSGEPGLETDTGRIKYGDGATAWNALRYVGSGWAAYVPVLTAVTTNPTLGSGSIAEGRWRDTGHELIVDVYIKFGASGVNAGNGQYRISLPANISTAGTARLVGNCGLYDASAASYVAGAVSRQATDKVQLLLPSAGVIAAHNVPWAWAANDELSLRIIAERA